MPGSKSSALENELLNSVLGGPVRSLDSIVYIALYTSAPTDAGGGTEVSGGSYARVGVTNNAVNWPAASGGSKSNGTVITFPAATANWGTVTAFGIHRHPTNDDLLLWGTLSSTKSVENGDTAQFAIGAITYTED